MKASELIERLNTLIAEHGDLDVGLRDAEFLSATNIGDVRVVTPDECSPHWSSSKELGSLFILIDCP